MDGTGNTADTDDDNDGLLDTEEQTLGTNMLKADSDDDGVIDKEEKEKGSNPIMADTDGDGTNDSEDDRPLVADKSINKLFLWIGAGLSFLLFLAFAVVYSKKVDQYN